MEQYFLVFYPPLHLRANNAARILQLALLATTEVVTSSTTVLGLAPVCHSQPLLKDVVAAHHPPVKPQPLLQLRPRRSIRIAIAPRTVAIVLSALSALARCVEVWRAWTRPWRVWYTKAAVQCREEFRERAEQGDTEAQCNLGLLRQRASGAGKNHRKAIEWYRKAAARACQCGGVLRRRHQCGQRRGEGRRMVPKGCSVAAAQGHAGAQAKLGKCYESRIGVKKDERRGSGVVVDEGKAVEWFRKAAEQGEASAHYFSRLCYTGGIGVDRDAVKLERSGFEKQPSRSMQLRAECLREVLCSKAEGRRRGEREEGGPMVPEGCTAQGDEGAQVQLGRCYLRGDRVMRDVARGVDCFCKAAEQGDKDALFEIGACYERGVGDAARGAEWFRRAAEQGHAGAQFNLGVCHERGAGVSKDEKKATEWYRKAAKGGSARAQNSLGVCYGAGTGVGQDVEFAEKWFAGAARSGDSMRCPICASSGREASANADVTAHTPFNVTSGATPRLALTSRRLLAIPR
ncbi:hypothetical protein KFL_000540120 [Klebsormidium nitens]|uniref:Uncharacterized protein n=1 Tax=Klebsormidium nitens TaxID=105231 RepID=A0A0U9HQD0_KLENI|nr:hypothetical protein KFL_000540120 [Klebsormidium nitens]|eukprot:GAQ80435.1 hypothetical protein KFL_000540120 [Klebsormidium nitens]